MIWTHAAALIVGMVIAFSGAWKVQEWRWSAREAELGQRIAQAEKKARERADGAATGFEVDRTALARERSGRVKEVERVVEKPVYRNECLDDDGLRVLAAAIAGTPSDPGKPAVPVPGPSAAR